MEEHFRKGKYVPLQTGQIPGLESKVILIDGAQLAELTFIITDYKDGWPHQSTQYQKAMRASFDWALWPPQKEKDLGHDSVLILRDGTELPSGGSAIGYAPGLEKKKSLCGREA